MSDKLQALEDIDLHSSNLHVIACLDEYLMPGSRNEYNNTQYVIPQLLERRSFVKPIPSTFNKSIFVYFLN